MRRRVRAHNPLPDDALTVFAAGGWGAIKDRIDAGMLATGDYLCPACGGTGSQDIINGTTKAMVPCVGCNGWGTVTLRREGDGIVKAISAGGNNL